MLFRSNKDADIARIISEQNHRYSVLQSDFKVMENNYHLTQREVQRLEGELRSKHEELDRKQEELKASLNRKKSKKLDEAKQPKNNDDEWI